MQLGLAVSPVVLVLEDGCVLPGSPAAGALPEMAFEADRHIIERYCSLGLTGVPVDPPYSLRKL